ncbi:ATP-binding protein [Citrobacter freundii]|nr:ATP-binding protein [Citrobacter freundii]
MKSLTTVRKKSPNYPVEFKIKMVELSHRPDIRVFAFASEDKEYQPLLDDILDGPMVGRFDTEEAGKALIDGGLIERLMSTIMPFITSEAPLPDTHLRRETTWYYPLEAIRETVVNALAHRDWTRFVEIEIGLYSNRFEVISPGALNNSMSIEKMVTGQRSPRNTIIMEVLRDYGYVDFRGMGVRTKIIPLTQAMSGQLPEFTAIDDYLKTILYRSPSS